jgi:D-lactate dehydrogenase (cytochrome)
VVVRIERFFEQRRERMRDAHVTHSCLLGTEGPLFFIEPMFYWRDELGPLHRRYLPPEKYERFFRKAAANPEARKVVLELRAELRDIFYELGAVHGQIGKFYDFEKAIEPGTYALLSALKDVLDPECRLNPGNFGWRNRKQ